MPVHVKIGAGAHVPHLNTKPAPKLSHTQATPPKQQHATTNKTDKNIHILQINSKQKELKQLAHTTQPNIITVEENKFITTSKTPNISNYLFALTKSWKL